MKNIPPVLAEIPREASHDVMTVFEQGLRSHTDAEVLLACQMESRVLISLDLDFSNILQFPLENYAGLIPVS